MRPVLLVLVILPLACSKPGDTAANAKAKAAPAAAAAAAEGTPSGAADPGGQASAVSEDTDLYSFEFAYPAAAGRIPALRRVLDQERDQARRELIAGAEAERKSLAAEGLEYRPHSYEEAWQTVAELPGWLSLSAAISTYEGGAHPNHGFDALLWDKAAGVRRKPIDLFAPAAFRSAVKQRFCAELDRQRAGKRDGEPIGDPGDWPNTCIDPLEEATLILGSSTRRSFDRVGFLIAPYSAGPYAEGDYEITLPVDRALLAAVKPEFRSAFALGR